MTRLCCSLRGFGMNRRDFAHSIRGVTADRLPVLPRCRRVCPKPYGFTANPYGSAPTVYRFAPNMYRFAPTMYRSAPNVYRFAPNVYRSAPNVYRFAPNVYRFAPNVYRFAPRQPAAISGNYHGDTILQRNINIASFRLSGARSSILNGRIILSIFVYLLSQCNNNRARLFRLLYYRRNTPG
jgi:hypothetical protein